MVKPAISKITKITTKIKNNTLAIAAAPAAMPVKPNSAAISEMIKKNKAHFSIIASY